MLSNSLNINPLIVSDIQSNISKLAITIATLATVKNKNKKTINGLLGANLVFNVESVVLESIYIFDYFPGLYLTVLPSSLSTVTTLSSLVVYNNKRLTNTQKVKAIRALMGVGLAANVLNIFVNSIYLFP